MTDASCKNETRSRTDAKPFTVYNINVNQYQSYVYTATITIVYNSLNRLHSTMLYDDKLTNIL